MAQTKYKLVIEAINKTKKTFKSITGALGKVGKHAKSAAKGVGGIGLAVAAVGAAFVAMGKKAFDALDSIGKTASRTGFAAESLQALRLGAVESGASVEGLNKAIEKFSKNIGDVIVKGTGEATYALDRMGISLYDNLGILKSNDQILREVSDGIKRMSSETEKNSALQGLFGRQGILMNQVFAEGAEGIDRWITKAKEMGIIISTSSLKAIENFNDRFAELQFMLNGLINQTFAALAPGLEKIVTQFKDWAVDSQKTGRNLEGLGTVIAGTLVEGLADMIEAFGEFIDFLHRGAIEIEYFAEKMKVSFASLRPIKAIIDLKKLEDQFNKDMAAVGKFGEKAKVTADILRDLFKPGDNGSGDDIKKKLEDIVPLFPQLNEAMKGFDTGFNNVFKNSETTLLKFTTLGEKVGKTLEDGLVNAFMNIRAGAEGLKDVMDQILKQIVSELIRVFIVQQAVGRVTGFFGMGKTPTPEATGGPVLGGNPYIVGERGPELFVPHGNGTIVPNNQLGGAGTNVNVTFDITSWDSRDTLQAISQQAPAIVGIIEQSFRKRGRRGPLGP